MPARSRLATRPRLRAAAFATGLAGWCALAAGAPAAAHDAEYRIHAGDTLTVSVLNQRDLSESVRVVDDGSINLPLAGTVKVGGRTPGAAADAITVALHRFVKAPNVTVAVAELADIGVIVSGAVTRPGAYTLRAGSHVTDALAMAGGMLPSLRGALPDGRLLRETGASLPIATNALLRLGDESTNYVVPDRATIFIPEPPAFDVQVLGAVDAPGTIRIVDGERLSAAISAAGASENAHADLSRIVVTRTGADGTTGSHVVDLYRALDGDRRYDPLLRANDIVLVPVAARTHGMLSNGLFLLKQLAGY